MINVEEYLQSKGIEYKLHEHPAVFTVAEAEKHCKNIPGMACKNLVLRDQKKERLFLFVSPAEKRIDMKFVAKFLGVSKLSFAKPEILREKLGLEPGSVSPFGVLHDVHQKIELVIDKDVYDAEIVSFHPNRNTATFELNRDMFHRFLGSVDNHIALFDITTLLHN